MFAAKNLFFTKKASAPATPTVDYLVIGGGGNGSYGGGGAGSVGDVQPGDGAERGRISRRRRGRRPRGRRRSGRGRRRAGRASSRALPRPSRPRSRRRPSRASTAAIRASCSTPWISRNSRRSRPRFPTTTPMRPAAWRAAVRFMPNLTMATNWAMRSNFCGRNCAR